MAKKNYEQIKQLVSALKPFTGNSMKAVRMRHDDSILYVVYSYQTAIALYIENDIEPMGLNHAAWVTTSKYGVTSSKQTNIVKNNWISFAETDESGLYRIIEKWMGIYRDYRIEEG